VRFFGVFLEGEHKVAKTRDKFSESDIASLGKKMGLLATEEHDEKVGEV
jgi:hypothetical protein